MLAGLAKAKIYFDAVWVAYRNEDMTPAQKDTVQVIAESLL